MVPGKSSSRARPPALRITEEAPSPVSLFITFEGPEGSGKTTQTHLLAGALRRQGHDVLTTREPGGTPIGSAVRTLLLDPAYTDISPRTEALLFNAARAQLVDRVIRPALAAGQVVLCDRYADSTLAYQGYGYGQDLTPLRYLVEYATHGLRPHLTVYLDIDPALGLRRKTNNSAEWNRMEEQALEFHRAVHRGYHQLAAEEPARWLVVKADQPIDAISTFILRRINELCVRGVAE